MTGTNQHYTQAVSFGSSMQSTLNNRDIELYELAKISGITIDPHVFKILVELLKLDISPAAIFNVLQNMSQQVSKPNTVSKKNSQNKSGTVQSSSKKKPPVAAKPKKIPMGNQEITF